MAVRGYMRRDSRKTWLLRAVGAVLLAVTFGYVPYHLYSRSGFSRYLELRQVLEAMRLENARLRAENGRLAREAEALRSDPRTWEREARTHLKWVRPGEIVFDLGGQP
jgi:cell division protein FtsB